MLNHSKFGFDVDERIPTNRIDRSGENRVNCSAAVLAGGKSSRMGTDKADLLYNGKSLLMHQYEKLVSLGITDIMISGHCTDIPSAVHVSDAYAGKGPLAGICACLNTAKEDDCLILSVDVPDVPADVLKELIQHQTGSGYSATVLKSPQGIEPLIAVYNKCLKPKAEALLETERTAVRFLLDGENVNYYFYKGDMSCLLNVNTPEDYHILCEKKNTLQSDS